MAFVDFPPDDTPALVGHELESEGTELGPRERAMGDGLFDFEVPVPPEVDKATGSPTANYGYEVSVAIWRDRVTRGLKAIHLSQVAYSEAEDRRHRDIMIAIKGQTSTLRFAFDVLSGVGSGCFDLAKTVAGNEAGQLKYFALTLLGLAGIANGIAFSGFGFSADSAVKCGRGTIEEHGRCIPEVSVSLDVVDPDSVVPSSD